MDVLALHQAGFLEAVATCGTALTEAHLARLRRYTRELVLLYDADEAGQAAVQRALLPALQAGFFVRVLSLPDCKDPDEFLRRHSPADLEALLKEAVSWPLYLASRSGSSAEARYHLLRQLGQHLQALPDPFMRRAYAEEIAEKLHIPVDFWETYQSVSAAPLAPLPRQSPRITAERELLRVALLYPQLVYEGMPLWQFLAQELRLFSLSEAPAEEVRQAFCGWEGPEPPEAAQLMETLSPEAQDWLAELLLERYRLSPHWRTWDDSPLQEDPLQVLETNLILLHLHHLQSLLEENLRYLEGIAPDEAAYQEHLAVHQVLVEQRTELAHRQGLILPYRKASPGRALRKLGLLDHFQQGAMGPLAAGYDATAPEVIGSPPEVRDLSSCFSDQQAPCGHIPGVEVHLKNTSRRPAATYARSSAADPSRRSPPNRRITSFRAVKYRSARSGSRYMKPVTTRSLSGSVVELTCKRSSPRKAPWPCTAQKVSCWGTAYTTPTMGFPRCRSATLMPKRGRPCTKFLVPSSGSITHTSSRSRSFWPLSSKTKPASGRRRAQASWRRASAVRST